MGNKMKKETNQLNDDYRNTANTNYQDFNRTQRDIGTQNQTNANSSFQGASSNYDYLSRGFGSDDPNYGGMGGAGGGSRASAQGYTAKTYDPSTYNAEDYKAKTYDAEGYQTQQGRYNLKGIDATKLDDAKAGYGEFAKTGGMDEEARHNFRLRGNAAVPSFYSNLQNQMATRRNTQGGYGAGFDASSEALARKAAQGTYESTLNTEGTLQDRIAEGRQWGIGGQADLGKFSQDLDLRHDTAQGSFAEAYANRQDAANMFSAGARNTANQYNTGSQNTALQFGAGARNTAAAFGAGARNDAGQFNANAQNNAMAFSAGAANSASAANAGLDERARQFNASEDSARRLAAGTGFSGLYSDSNQAVASANSRWLGGLGQNDQQNNASLGNRYQYNNGINWGGIGRGIGTAATLGASYWLSSRGNGQDPNRTGTGNNGPGDPDDE